MDLCTFVMLYVGVHGIAATAGLIIQRDFAGAVVGAGLLVAYYFIMRRFVKKPSHQ